MALRFRSQVSTVDTEYGTVLLDERTGAYWQLNPTGAAVVRMLLDGYDPEQAAAALTEKYDVDAEQARRDVAALVDGLRGAELVTS
ncbi:lasso peptide biosynthesis PqqD family chaperone [Streptomyces sp. NPDC055966]|uniref:lasso peptide biosynthesis PqqD family chaperone n=1 Tax=unclassified Streptomyces TaxID=2593676 RepID=UPI0035D8BC67